jgi:hypothetical protein
VQPSGSTAPRSNLALAECSMLVRRCLNAWKRPCFVCGSSGARTSSADLVIPQRTRRSPLFIKKYTLSVTNWWCPGSIVAVNGMAFACLGPPRYSRRLLGCSVRGRRVVHDQATTQFLTTDSSVAGYHKERFGGTKLCSWRPLGSKLFALWDGVHRMQRPTGRTEVVGVREQTRSPSFLVL